MSKQGKSLLPEPKAKENSTFPRYYPFPIIHDASEENACRTIIGYLRSNCVEIMDKSNIKSVYSMGFFGSRSTPQVLKNKIKGDAGWKKKNRSWSKSKQNTKEHKNESSAKYFDPDEGAEEEEIPAKRLKEYDESGDRSDGSGVESDGYDEESDGYVDRSDDVPDGYTDVSDGYVKVSKSDVPLDDYVVSELESSIDENSDSPSDSIRATAEMDEREYLQLSFEEAYFLSYGLGVLVVKDKNQPLDLRRLWHKFCEMHESGNFPVIYTAYHHFRSKGWIVRSGTKYGTDFVLYKDGPPFYHSSYAVIVQHEKQQNMQDIIVGGRPNLTWSSLAGLKRMCDHVSKDVIFLYVIEPATMSENDISTPHCVSQYQLEEFLVKRWVPSSDRSDK